MGVIAGLAGAFSWAFASTLLATQTGKLDSLSASAIRASAAFVFMIAALFVLGGVGDVGRMSATDVLQLMGTGLVNLLIGESLYAASVSAIGLTRSFTTVMGTYNLTAFSLAALLLGEPITLRIGGGALLIFAGVYLVATYGRAAHDRANAAGAAAKAGEVRLPLIGTLSGGATTGVILGLCAGVAWGTGAVWLRHASDGIDASAASFVRMPPAMLLLVIAAVLQSSAHRRSRHPHIPRRAIGLVAASGILTQGVSSILFILTLAEVGAGQTVVLFSTAPLWGLVLGAFILREPITRWVVVGSVLAILGIALLAL